MIPKNKDMLRFQFIELWGVTNGVCNCPLKNDCKSIGKHPRYKGFKPVTLESITNNSNKSNIAILCNDNLVVIDIDPRNGGLDSLAALKKQGLYFPETLTVTTGGRGLHYYYRSNKPLRSFKLPRYNGIDVQANGAYVVAPPSIHASGECYAWEDDEQEIADLPSFIYDFVPVHNVQPAVTKELSFYEKEDVLKALQFIDPNCNYETWWKVGAALHSSGFSYEVFEEWSSKSKSKFNKLSCEKQWNNLSKCNNISIGTLFYYAELAGYIQKETPIKISLKKDIEGRKVEQYDTLLQVLRNTVTVPDYPPCSAGELSQFIFDSAPFHNKQAAIQASLSVISAVTQGVYRTDTRGSGTGGKLLSYNCLIAKAGEGKQHYTSAVENILMEVTPSSMVGTFQSKQALHARLHDNNNLALISSEILSFFKKITNEKNPVTSDILDSVLRIWDNADWLLALESKKKENGIPAIPNAHLTIFGGGVHDDLITLLQLKEFYASGFLSRLDIVIVDTFQRAASFSAYPEPEHIKRFKQRLKGFRPEGVTKINLNFSEKSIAERTIVECVHKINVTHDKVNHLILRYFDNVKALRNEIEGDDTYSDKDKIMIYSVINRIPEKAIRTASALTVTDSVTESSILSEKLLLWAYNWHMYHAIRLIDFFSIKQEFEIKKTLLASIYSYRDKYKLNTFTLAELYKSHKRLRANNVTLLKHGLELISALHDDIDISKNRKGGYVITLSE